MGHSKAHAKHLKKAKNSFTLVKMTSADREKRAEESLQLLKDAVEEWAEANPQLKLWKPVERPPLFSLPEEE